MQNIAFGITFAINKTCGPGKGIRSCTQTCHVVGYSQARRWGVADAAHTLKHVWKCQKQSACGSQLEWRVQCERQGSCLSPLLFISLLETRFQDFRTGCPWENLSADDLVIIAGSLGELQQKLIIWKTRKEKDFGSTWAKAKSWYLCWGSMWFRSPAKTHVACVPRYNNCALTGFCLVGRLGFRRQRA